LAIDGLEGYRANHSGEDGYLRGYSKGSLYPNSWITAMFLLFFKGIHKTMSYTFSKL
jgi:hypothetical protein